MNQDSNDTASSGFLIDTSRRGKVYYDTAESRKRQSLQNTQTDGDSQFGHQVSVAISVKQSVLLATLYM